MSSFIAQGGNGNEDIARNTYNNVFEEKKHVYLATFAKL